MRYVLCLSLLVMAGCYQQHVVDSSALETLSSASKRSNPVSVRNKEGEEIELKRPSESTVRIRTQHTSRDFSAPFEARVLPKQVEIRADRKKMVYNRDQILEVRVYDPDMTNSLLLSSGLGAGAGLAVGLLLL